MYCIECGTKVDEAQIKCLNCGHDQSFIVMQNNNKSNVDNIIKSSLNEISDTLKAIASSSNAERVEKIKVLTNQSKIIVIFFLVIVIYIGYIVFPTNLFRNKHEIRCVNEIFSRLNDPDSAKVISVDALDGSNGFNFIIINVRARNGFGAFIMNEFTCTFKDDKFVRFSDE